MSECLDPFKHQHLISVHLLWFCFLFQVHFVPALINQLSACVQAGTVQVFPSTHFNPVRSSNNNSKLHIVGPPHTHGHYQICHVFVRVRDSSKRLASDCPVNFTCGLTTINVDPRSAMMGTSTHHAVAT